MLNLRKVMLMLLMGTAGWQGQCHAAVVMIGTPGVVVTQRQPVQAVVVDCNGNTFNQTVYYDPALGGVDLNLAGAGPNASVYFPAYGSRYMWYNGFWVDQGGAYIDGGRRVYVSHPHWHDHWNGYWAGGWHGGHGGGGYRHTDVHVHETVNVYNHGGGHYHHH